MLFGLNENNCVFYIVLVFVIFMGIKMFLESDAYNLKCIISDVDGEKYCVRDRSKLKDAANLLAETSNKMQNLVDYVAKKYPDNPDVNILVSRFNPSKISETLPTSEHTAYSENKGEKLAFCLNKKKKDEDKLIDPNTLMFVAIHELAHVMTMSEGHKQVFWQNFKFLLVEAKESGIYTPVDYKKNPEPYCGMEITDNPYYDLV
jgi:hypothetical protein